MKSFHRILLFTILLSFPVGCSNAQTPGNVQERPDKCSFLYTGYMGFSPWPYDLTGSAVEKTYNFINQNATIISHHLDGGVPWNEALNDTDFPAHLKEDWNRRTSLSSSHLKTFLSITPLSFNRDSLAPNWGETSENQPLPSHWRSKRLNDPEVKKAFANYALRAVDHFKPDYLAIGIESNIIITKAPSMWPAYMELHRHTYKKVKQKHPSLPVFATVQYEHMRGIEDAAKPNLQKQNPAVRDLMKYSDLMGLSTYRYGSLHPNPPRPDYFKQALAFGKTIAIAESGAMSKTTRVMGMNLKSNQKIQREFIQMLLTQGRKHDFPFIINWLAIDFNDMLPKLPSEAQELAKAWVHHGMLDSAHTPKQALRVWQRNVQGNNRCL